MPNKFLRYETVGKTLYTACSFVYTVLVVIYFSVPLTTVYFVVKTKRHTNASALSGKEKMTLCFTLELVKKLERELIPISIEVALSQFQLEIFLYSSFAVKVKVQ